MWIHNLENRFYKILRKKYTVWLGFRTECFEIRTQIRPNKVRTRTSTTFNNRSKNKGLSIGITSKRLWMPKRGTSNIVPHVATSFAHLCPTSGQTFCETSPRHWAAAPLSVCATPAPCWRPGAPPPTGGQTSAGRWTPGGRSSPRWQSWRRDGRAGSAGWRQSPPCPWQTVAQHPSQPNWTILK